jgi:2-amino-4-hydroxy-6-hydroxymethyldihydropteridine diphosphokinase
MGLEHTTAYLLLGTNLGSRHENLEHAIALLNDEVGKVTASSAVYETAAWGKTDQPSFLNQALSLETNFTALQLLDKVLEIEKILGRVRKEKWGERIIDIDIILFGDEIVNIENKLQIPHPQMEFRNFVMEPLSEIAGNVIHPILKKTINELSKKNTDKLEVNRL